jgi:hypothetical protein
MKSPFLAEKFSIIGQHFIRKLLTKLWIKLLDLMAVKSTKIPFRLGGVV